MAEHVRHVMLYASRCSNSAIVPFVWRCASDCRKRALISQASRGLNNYQYSGSVFLIPLRYPIPQIDLKMILNMILAFKFLTP